MTAPRLFMAIGPVVITRPAIGESLTVDSYCNVSVSGCGAAGQVANVLEVEGRINGGTVYGGSVSGRDWSIGAIGKVGTYCTNTLEIRIKYESTAGGAILWSEWTPRDFIGVGDAACYGYCQPEMVPAAPSAPISLPLPRFMRLTFVAQVGNQQPSVTASFGGLLQRTSVYLAYDSHASTAYESVWRDINLPESMGKWTLRGWTQGDRMVAEMSLFQMTNDTIMPPVMFRIPNWDPNGQTLMQADCASCGGGAIADALLQLEPA